MNSSGCKCSDQRRLTTALPLVVGAFLERAKTLTLVNFMALLLSLDNLANPTNHRAYSYNLQPPPQEALSGMRHLPRKFLLFANPVLWQPAAMSPAEVVAGTRRLMCLQQVSLLHNWNALPTDLSFRPGVLATCTRVHHRGKMHRRMHCSLG